MNSRLRWNETIWRRTQTVVLWFLGAGGIVNELFLQPKPRPEAFPIIGALIGLPFAQAFDRGRRSQGSTRKDSQTDPGSRS